MRKILYAILLIAAVAAGSCGRNRELPPHGESAAVYVDCDSIAIELADTVSVHVDGTDDFTVRVADESLLKLERRGRELKLTALAVGTTSLRLLARERPAELIVPVRVFERRTPWSFDDALADASLRFESAELTLRYADGGIMTERSEDADGRLTYRMIRPADGSRVALSYMPGAVGDARLTIDGEPHALSSAAIGGDDGPVLWFNLSSAVTGRRMVLVVRK